MSATKKRAPKKGAKKSTKPTIAKVLPTKAERMRAAKRRNRRNPELKAYGAMLREARMAKGLSQRQLARLLSVTQPCICNVERAVAGASRGLRIMLARSLDAPGLQC